MTAFINAYLIDGAGSEAVTNATVLTDGRYITAVGHRLVIPPDSEIVDVGGRTLLPGLMDAHVHLGGSDSFEGDLLVGGAKSDNYQSARVALLNYGVTTIRSGGDFEGDILALRDLERSAGILSPRIFAPGKYFQAENAHPAFTVWGGDPDIIENAIFVPETAEDARAEVLRQARLGVDHIKIFLADMDYMHPGTTTRRIAPDVLAAVTECAHENNLRVMVHCQDPAFAKEALDAGADSIEHLFCSGHELDPLPDGISEAFLKNGAFLVPTLASAEAMRTDEKKLRNVRKSIKRLFDDGVKIAVGTDSGTPLISHGGSLHREIELLCGCGLPPMDALMAATSRGAELVGRSDLGLIAPGKRADIIVIEGNPLIDITATRNIRIVMRDGKIMINQ
jgi:enamidase